MDGWLRVTDAINAIESLGSSETIEDAEHLKREAILAISQIQHHNSKVSASLKMIEAAPIEITTIQTWETGGPVQHDRYASFSDTGEPVADQLW